jgi:hypothetical protein
VVHAKSTALSVARMCHWFHNPKTPQGLYTPSTSGHRGPIVPRSYRAIAQSQRAELLVGQKSLHFTLPTNFSALIALVILQSTERHPIAVAVG